MQIDKKKKLKVLLYGDYHADCSGYGKILKELIPVFTKEGHDVRQVALRYNGLYQHKYKETIKIYPTQIRGTGSYWASEVLDYAINEFEPDIVFSIQDYFVIPFLSQVITKPRKHPLKWVHYGTLDGKPLPPEVIYANGWINYHICMSKYAHSEIYKLLPKSSSEVIYPPTNPEIFKQFPDKKNIRKKLKVDNTFNVLFIGRNQFRKNLPALMEAVKKLVPRIPNIRLLHHSTGTLTPDGDNAGIDIASISKFLNISDFIAHVKTGKIDVLSEEMIAQLYNISDVLVLPSYGEGFGLPLIEAMACGLPTIGTDCSSISEVIGDRGILVPSCAHIYMDGKIQHSCIDVDKLADAIYKMYSDKKLRDECSYKGLEFVKNLTPVKVGKRILDVFQKVIDEDIQSSALK